MKCKMQRKKKGGNPTPDDGVGCLCNLEAEFFSLENSLLRDGKAHKSETRSLLGNGASVCESVCVLGCNYSPRSSSMINLGFLSASSSQPAS